MEIPQRCTVWRLCHKQQQPEGIRSLRTYLVCRWTQWISGQSGLAVQVQPKRTTVVPVSCEGATGGDLCLRNGVIGHVRPGNPANRVNNVLYCGNEKCLGLTHLDRYHGKPSEVPPESSFL